MSGIQDKVIAITGASGGIGQAVARVLAGRGAKVMLGARRIGRLNALAREIVEAGGSAHYQTLDVTQRASMQCFIDEANEVFGRVDVIVHAVASASAASCTTRREVRAITAPDAIERAIALAIDQSPDVGASQFASPRLAQVM
ncbi:MULTISPECIES: SDR family NAD(P)-dependent oxidoreductase [unclassified Variovorax]|uniref:SDR family oxidoreductase n=1 Tax=unclassified Variovorax TaxID=663243 RepID=UPI00076C9E09|nr:MULTISPECIES: SDR family NAD(P)-dependent oxidoreductase [unclassified Variovorax]KWT94338.1 short-chain dehydrogenase/reductase SDR [Variovorax sp. WDL1]PNG59070.1 putative oxidoreductase [Variovorax sp. B4]PNG61139.1 putative oxidoreductase [Variovorax sp. B2]VTV12898.1 putative oxidoreductase [Variovorax sp. WDL1]